MRIKRFGFYKGDYFQRDSQAVSGSPLAVSGKGANPPASSMPAPFSKGGLYEQKQIVWHHTVSNGSAEAVAEWFGADHGASKIATAYVIALDGTILQLFDPVDGWAYHTGLYGQGDKNVIGIEIVNAGPLVKKTVKNLLNGKDEEKYFWLDGKYEFTGKVFDNGKVWRGISQYWAAYTDTQIQAVGELTAWLCDRFDIPKKVLSDLAFKAEYCNWKGIIAHCNIRKDKSDVSCAFDFMKAQKVLMSA